jgi:hypothetical protein
MKVVRDGIDAAPASGHGGRGSRVSTDPTLTFGFAAVLVVHAAIHVAGFLKAFRLVDLQRLTQPIPRVAGLAWLAAGAGFGFAALLFLAGSGRWRLLAAAAVPVSQVLIFMDFRDAGFGSLGNALVILGIVFIR